MSLKQTLYQKISTTLSDRIVSGEYPLGTNLPTEANLCEEFKASHHTIRDALKLLIEKGLISRRPGAGTKVIAASEPTVFAHVAGDLRHLFSYPQNTIRQNILQQHVVSDRILSQLLDCPIGTPWFKIGALRRLDGNSQPLCWTDFYILPRYSDVVKHKSHFSIPVHEQIEALYGERVESAKVKISLTKLDAEMAKELDVPSNSSALRIVRSYQNVQKNAFEITVSYHPEGRYDCELNFHRELRPR
ncbi:GntR family transcriptional regulator [Polynucleobacter sinensis]|uniref:GntR family transcriptional regulator n=1 Tax=Polynucleobacter sinensis TaxID=1743157 RepID=UPI00078533C5|nr:GntR family transcriptional regulator [Polynucleobacter sinensis]